MAGGVVCQSGLAVRAGQPGVAGQSGVIAGVPVSSLHANDGAERVGQVLGQLAAATGAGEPREQSARSGA